MIKFRTTLPVILCSLMLAAIPILAQGKIFKRVDKDGNVYFTDKPENLEEAKEKTRDDEESRKKAHIERLNREYGYSGDNKLTKKQIENIEKMYNQLKEEHEELLQKSKTACGEEPYPSYWTGPGEVRDRYMAWEGCADQFKDEITKKEKQLRAAQRKYLWIK